jgi:hypothetical protein
VGIKIEEAFYALERWIDRNGWESYDVCDVKALPLFLFINNFRQKNVLGKYLAHPFLKLEESHTSLLRKLFMVKKNIFPQAIGLIARTYLSVYRYTNNHSYLAQALKCLNWLEQHPSKDYSNLCWGQPYDWTSREIIPKHTPRTTVTTIVAGAFLDAYELNGERKYLDVAKSSCDFFIDDLNWKEDEQGTLCFSYTTKDNFHIHNANMLAAAILIRTWHHCKNRKYKKMGTKAIKFTLKHQNKDGSWYYWAPPDKVIGKIDNYHTGFILESLEVIRRYLGKSFQYDNVIDSGLDFYLNNFFENGIIPKMFPGDTYPINIQSCAQSIITFGELKDRYPDLKERSIKIAQWTIENLYHQDGYFYHQIRKGGYVDKTPYIRWAESWMLRALSFLIFPPDHVKKKIKKIEK